MQTGNNHKTATKKSNVAKILLVLLQMDFFPKPATVWPKLVFTGYQMVTKH